jgi:hypothetical protein
MRVDDVMASHLIEALVRSGQNVKACVKEVFCIV